MLHRPYSQQRCHIESFLFTPITVGFKKAIKSAQVGPKKQPQSGFQVMTLTLLGTRTPLRDATVMGREPPPYHAAPLTTRKGREGVCWNLPK